MKKIALIGLLCAVIGGSGWYIKTTIAATADAYLYGYPLVLMDETRKAMDQKRNRLYHNQTLPDHTFRAVVRPNNDTVYSISWLDLTNEPQVLSVPQADERYYVMPFMDAWTNVFATVGTRATGTKAGDYALVGPDWEGELPPGLTRIEAPTNMVWMIGRIQINDQADIARVKTLQHKFNLTSLQQWTTGVRAPSEVIVATPKAREISPMKIVENMDAKRFFNALNQLMKQQNPASADRDLLDRIQALQVGPNLSYSPNVLSEYIMNSTLSLAREKITEAASVNRAEESGWSIARDGIGRYGTDYKSRAFIAHFGLGALPPEEAVYPNANIDNRGNPLTGQHNYRLHFDAANIPPADAFWSITMYDEQGFLVDNPLQRYTLGDRNSLEFNADGSLDIFLQQKAPPQGESNWLPSPASPFAVTMRLYLPQSDVLDGRWVIPGVEKMP